MKIHIFFWFFVCILSWDTLQFKHTFRCRDIEAEPYSKSGLSLKNLK